jgi:hypothetical protein
LGLAKGFHFNGGYLFDIERQIELPVSLSGKSQGIFGKTTSNLSGIKWIDHFTR